MKTQLLQKVAYTLLIISLLILGIILGKTILVPLFVSFLFAYLIYPLVRLIERGHVHRVIAILMVLLLALVIVAGGILFVSVKVSNLSINLPELQQQINDKLTAFQQAIESTLGMEVNTMDNFLRKAINNIFTAWESKAGVYFSATTTTLFQIAMLPVFTFFLLFYRTKTAYFIFKMVGKKNKLKTLQILREITSVTTRYVRGILIVVLILALLNTTGLLIIGVPNALAFGILSALLNLIPYFGTLIGGLIPILYVLFTYTAPFQPIFQIIILFIIVQFLENNLLTPNIVGSNIQLNPFAIIISLLVANMIWGIAGMLIVVPILAILKIIMRNVDALEPFAYLIGDNVSRKHKVDFVSFFQQSKQKIEKLLQKRNR